MAPAASGAGLPERQQPSCRLLSLHKSQHRSGFSRLPDQDQAAAAAAATTGSGARGSPQQYYWRRLVRKLLPMHGVGARGGSKRRQSFSYDVESYRKNFDDDGGESCSSPTTPQGSAVLLQDGTTAGDT